MDAGESEESFAFWPALRRLVRQRNYDCLTCVDERGKGSRTRPVIEKEEKEKIELKRIPSLSLFSSESFLLFLVLFFAISPRQLTKQAEKTRWWRTHACISLCVCVFCSKKNRRKRIAPLSASFLSFWWLRDCHGRCRLAWNISASQVNWHRKRIRLLKQSRLVFSWNKPTKIKDSKVKSRGYLNITGHGERWLTRR